MEASEPAAEGESGHKWLALLSRARRLLWTADQPVRIARLEEALAQAIARGDLRAQPKVFAQLYRSMAHWRRTGVFEAPFHRLSEAKLQYWELEHHCPVFEYQHILLREIRLQYPRAIGFDKQMTVFDHTPPGAPERREDRNRDVNFFETPGAERTIIGFSGLTGNCLGVGWSTFYRAAAAPAKANLLVVRDLDRRLYLRGIRSLGSLDESFEALAEMAAPFRSTGEVVVLGGSGGTFGALMFAARTSVADRVVALSGPTSLDLGAANEDKQVYDAISEDIATGAVPYVDLAKLVSQSGIRRIDFFVAGRNAFDMSQMRNLLDRTDVVVPHVYPTEHHTMTDFCVADGKLLRAIRGVDLPPTLLPDDPTTE